MPEHYISDESFETLSDYESWVKQDWLYEQGSAKALQHARGKLDEEVEELIEALHDGDPDEIRSEGGDVLWTATAVAINNGPGIERSFRHSSWHRVLPEGELGIAAIDAVARRRRVRQDWSRNDGFAAGDLSESRREIHRCVRKGEVGATEITLRGIAKQLGKTAGSLHWLENVLGDDVSELTREESPCLWIDVAYSCEAVSQLYVACSSIARTRLGTGLADMMEANRQKLQSRLAKGAPITTVPGVSGLS